MTPQENEDFYVHLSEMETDELLTVDMGNLSTEEASVLHEVLVERREEVEDCIAAMFEVLADKKQKKGRKISIPMALYERVRELDRLQIGDKIVSVQK